MSTEPKCRECGANAHFSWDLESWDCGSYKARESGNFYPSDLCKARAALIEISKLLDAAQEEAVGISPACRIAIETPIEEAQKIIEKWEKGQ